MEFPKRKPTRLNNYDYSQNGYYFITVCTHNKENLLCDIVGEGFHALPQVRLTAIGDVVNESIRFINKRYDGVFVDNYVIMPNHLHLIIAIQTGGDRTPPLRVYDIIGRMKEFTTNRYDGRLWQRSFHDHVIRGEADYRKIWDYIDQNPAKWAEDRFYTK